MQSLQSRDYRVVFFAFAYNRATHSKSNFSSLFPHWTVCSYVSSAVNPDELCFKEDVPAIS
jgi:hypothetical protein